MQDPCKLQRWAYFVDDAASSRVLALVLLAVQQPAQWYWYRLILENDVT